MSGSERERRLSPELRQRIGSGTVLALGGIIAILTGGWPLAIWVALGTGLMVWELAAMARQRRRLKRSTTLACFSVGALPALLAMIAPPVLPVLASTAASAALAMLIRTDDLKRRVVALLGLAIGCAGALMISLRAIPESGLAIALWQPVAVAFADMGGYFVGKRFGGPKLAPLISPNKTWSGAIGGVLCAMTVSALFASVTGGWPLALAMLGGVTAIVSQAGDLCESALKRRLGFKDASNLIPGHGGVLDRFDGLAAATLFIGGALLLAPGLAVLW